MDPQMGSVDACLDLSIPGLEVTSVRPPADPVMVSLEYAESGAPCANVLKPTCRARHMFYAMSSTRVSDHFLCELIC